MKRIISVLFCILFVFSAVSVTAFAENGDIDLPIIDIGGDEPGGGEQEDTKIWIVNMQGYNGATIDYKSTITFRCGSENASEIVWVVNGKPQAADRNGSCTVSKVKKDIEIYCYTKNAEGKIISSEIETVHVSRGFIDMLKAFFRDIFGKLPTYVQ